MGVVELMESAKVNVMSARWPSPAISVLPKIAMPHSAVWPFINGEPGAVKELAFVVWPSAPETEAMAWAGSQLNSNLTWRTWLMLRAEMLNSTVLLAANPQKGPSWPMKISASALGPAAARRGHAARPRRAI